MVSTKNKGGRSRGAQNFGQFCSWLCMVFWEGGFLSVICKKVSSIYSSVTETKEVQRLIMKVGSNNMCLLSCQFYYTYETCKNCAL